MPHEPVIDWLLEGDPVIRWQTMRDLLGRQAAEWQAERERTPEIGWGKRFLEFRQEDGAWPEGRWTGTVWTLLTIIDCGLPPGHPPLVDSARLFLERHLSVFDRKDPLRRVDLCHLGFWLRIGAYFEIDDPRLSELTRVIFDTQMADGGWNCRIRTNPKVRHSSFHTTFNVLEGLRTAVDAGIADASVFARAEAAALEFMLDHRMYRSDKTGEIIDHRFTQLTFPSHWHYTIPHRPRLYAIDPRDRRRSPRRPHRPADQPPKRERTMADRRPNPRRHALRHGKTRQRKPLEYPTRPASP